MYEEVLAEAVLKASVPVYMTTKAQIVEYYQDTHPGHWVNPLVQELKKITKTERKDRTLWETLGNRLAPIGFNPPANGYSVMFAGYIRISRDCYYRSFIRHITGSDAIYLMTSPDYATIFDAYFDNEEPGFVSEVCFPPTVIITAL